MKLLKLLSGCLLWVTVTSATAQSFMDQYIPYTRDSVHLEIYLFEFPDKENGWSESQRNSQMEEVNQYYQEQSNGKFQVGYSVYPEVTELPNSSEWYADNWHDFIAYYEEKIIEFGSDADEPGLDRAVIVNIPDFGNYNSSGGPPLMRLYGEVSVYTLVHELGHVLGLRHAQAIEAGNDIIGVGNEDEESINYGNLYCIMGGGDPEDSDFNIVYKNYFGWIEPHELIKVNRSGTYRIYAHDQPKRSGEALGLTIASGDNQYTYWVEYLLDSEYCNESGGVVVHLADYFLNSGNNDYWDTIPHILDMTPNSFDDGWWGDDFKDAQLLIGETYTDHWGGFTIKPVGRSEGPPDENSWIDLEIEWLGEVTALGPREKYNVLTGPVSSSSFNIQGQRKTADLQRTPRMRIKDDRLFLVK